VTVSDVRDRLNRAGLDVAEESRLPNNTGTKLKLSCGAIVNAFDSGNVNVQGKGMEPVKAALGLTGTTSAVAAPVEAPKTKVFVVYGHDPNSRHQLEAMLRRWGLEPLILDQLPTEGQTVIEKLESAITDVDFAVVLATPDDEGFRAGQPGEKAFRARQNVVLEMGMLLARLGRHRVAILLKEQATMERPSDIQGLIYIPFTADIAREAGVSLARAMDAQGFRIEIAKL